MKAMCRSVLAVMLLAAGCVGSIEHHEGDEDEGPIGHTPKPDAGVITPPGPDAGVVVSPPGDPGVAPADAVPGEKPLADGANSVTLGSAQTIYRLEANPGQHVAFALTFSAGTGITMAVDRWNGTSPIELGLTDAGASRRLLSVLDPDLKRTYWVRLKAAGAATATLTVTRTAFSEGPKCTADCARLIQMPLPNDPAADGYDTDGGTIFRYWFGRRDLVMQVRYAARQRGKAGKSPIFPYDFSQWDGLTPGTDVGAPRHVSHQRGKDVDLSMVGSDGGGWWRSFCTTHAVDGGRACIAGTRKDYDGYESALEIGSNFESGRVTMSFLDRELIPAVVDGAKKAVQDGRVSSSLLPLYSDGKHIQHWPNHDNHVHVRVAETDYNAKVDFEEPFEAP